MLRHFNPKELAAVIMANHEWMLLSDIHVGFKS